MSNICLKVSNERFSKLRFSGFKKFVTRSVFGELQLTQISLNFKTSCCNLKIRSLGAKLCVAFLLFYFGKELRRFKVKVSMQFVKQRNGMENGKPFTQFQRDKTCASANIRSPRKKKDGTLPHFTILPYGLLCPRKIFLIFLFYLNVQCTEYTFRI